MTRIEVMERIKECEELGLYQEHVDPVDFSNVIHVDENFHYLKHPLGERIVYFFKNIFVVLPFTFHLNKVRFKKKVVGKENLKGIDAAVITCNHVDKFDCLAVKGTVGRRLYITAAPFNNQKGWLGGMMRVGGMLPMSEEESGMIAFNNALSTLLHSHKFILYYPEQAMWWHYRKPRPLKKGAFYTAVKNNVPVIPMFITFTGSGKFDEEGIEKDHFTLHISKPIYPDKNMSEREQIEDLRLKNFEAWKKTYEEFYKCELNLSIN